MKSNDATSCKKLQRVFSNFAFYNEHSDLALQVVVVEAIWIESVIQT